MLAMGMIGAVAGTITFAAFFSTTSNPGNAFSAGTVSISDNDLGGAMFSVSGMKPGDTATGCIRITYEGSLSSNVHLYKTVTAGNGLDTYLSLTITRGGGAPTFNTCGAFTADTTVYIGGQPVGVIYNDTIANMGTSYSTGVTDPNATSPETWTTGESHDYKFVVTLQNNNSAQGLNVTVSFTWEAQNL